MRTLPDRTVPYEYTPFQGDELPWANTLFGSFLPDLRGRRTAVELLRDAGLDWDVTCCNIYARLSDGSFLGIKNKYACVNEATKFVLAISGRPQWHTTPSKLLSYLDPLVREGKAEYTTAVYLSGDDVMCVFARMAETMVINGEIIDFYAVLMNGYKEDFGYVARCIPVMRSINTAFVLPESKRPRKFMNAFHLGLHDVAHRPDRCLRMYLAFQEKRRALLEDTYAQLSSVEVTPDYAFDFVDRVTSKATRREELDYSYVRLRFARFFESVFAYGRGTPLTAWRLYVLHSQFIENFWYGYPRDEPVRRISSMFWQMMYMFKACGYKILMRDNAATKRRRNGEGAVCDSGA